MSVLLEVLGKRKVGKKAMLHISSVEPNKGNLVCFDIGFALFQDDLFHYVKFKFILSLNLLCEKSLMPKYNWLFVYIFSASQLNLWNSKFKSTVSLRQKRILWKKTNLPTRENIQGLKRQTRFSQILILPIQWQKRWFTTDELYIFFFVCMNSSVPKYVMILIYVPNSWKKF